LPCLIFEGKAKNQGLEIQGAPGLGHKK